MKYNKSKKNFLKKKIKTKRGGSSRCSLNIPSNPIKIVNSGNCNVGKPDCFNNPPLPQLGILPTTPNLSEIVYDGRYCCGNDNAGSQNGGGKMYLSDGIINLKDIINSKFKNTNLFVSNGRFSTEGIDKKDALQIQKKLTNKKIKSSITNYALGGYKLYFDDKKLHSQLINHQNFNKIGNNQLGGNGYYLSLDSCPPGGLSTVKGYDSCCPPVFSGSLTGNNQNSIYNPFENKYYVPALQQKMDITYPLNKNNNKVGGKKSKKVYKK